MKNICHQEPVDLAGYKIVLDGGALLWTCDWKKGETFESICMKYVRKCQCLGANFVVFDGYEQTSTKSDTQILRAKNSFADVEINLTKKTVTDRNNFMGCYTNKKRFINMLAHKLTSHGINVVQAKADADTIIVKTALDIRQNKKTKCCNNCR